MGLPGEERWEEKRKEPAVNLCRQRLGLGGGSQHERSEQGTYTGVNGESGGGVWQWREKKASRRR